MRKKWIVRLFGIALFAVVFIAGFGQAVLQLWNLLMPKIFGLPQISFWQAVGLLSLSWILFGGFRGFGGMGYRRRHRMAERWDDADPTQREILREGLKRRCGKWESEPTA